MEQTEAQRLWIRALTTLDSLGHPSPTTNMLRARLFSCVATMLWRVGFSHSLGILHIDALEVAGFCSNEAASLGFISPTVLAVGGIMKGLIESPTEAFNHRIQGWKRFELIFAAVEKRNKESRATRKSLVVHWHSLDAYSPAQTYRVMHASYLRVRRQSDPYPGRCDWWSSARLEVASRVPRPEDP